MRDRESNSLYEAGEEAEVPVSRRGGPFALAMRRLLRKKIAVVALAAIAIFYFCGVSAPWVSPRQLHRPESRQRPSGTVPGASLRHRPPGPRHAQPCHLGRSYHDRRHRRHLDHRWHNPRCRPGSSRRLRRWQGRYRHHATGGRVLRSPRLAHADHDQRYPRRPRSWHGLAQEPGRHAKDRWFPRLRPHLRRSLPLLLGRWRSRNPLPGARPPRDRVCARLLVPWAPPPAASSSTTSCPT